MPKMDNPDDRWPRVVQVPCIYLTHNDVVDASESQSLRYISRARSC